jgi:hypothetical protein
MTATEFFTWQESLGHFSTWTDAVRKERSERFKTLSPEDKHLVKRDKIEKFFIPENALPGVREDVSPSGRWKLVVTSYKTTPGAWSYTRGEVYDTTTGAKVADVRRNYSCFWSLWAEDHAVTGDDYLLCGEDYQGYTVVNLTRGVQRSYIPDEAFEGHGWCPADGEVVGHGTMLKLEGCYWACPYNYRILDFSSPDAPDFEHNGLPDFTEDLFLDMDDELVLELAEDKTLTLTRNQRCFKATGEWENYEISAKQTALDEQSHKAKRSEDPALIAEAEAARAAYDAIYVLDQEDLWTLVVTERQVYRLVEGKYVLHEEWKHEKVLKREAELEEREAQRETERARYKAADPFLPSLRARFPEASYNVSYRSLRGQWDGDTNPLYFHIWLGDGREISWGADHGEFKARGKGADVVAFPRTVDGLEEALKFLGA